jgi:hypothetical protein
LENLRVFPFFVALLKNSSMKLKKTYLNLKIQTSIFLLFGFLFFLSPNAKSQQAGENWQSVNQTTANNWASVTYGNGMFVAVSSDGTNRVMTSNDGINWNLGMAPDASSWKSITFGNGTFVAVDDGLNLMRSTNGIDWTTGGFGVSASNLSVHFANGIFLGFTDGNPYSSLVTSTDATNWVGYQLPGVSWSNFCTSVAYGNGVFVIVSEGGTNRVRTSSNGTSWTVRTAAESNAWKSITFGNGTFVAVSSNGTNRVMTSTNGIDWTAQSVPLNSWSSVTFGDGLFVAVSTDGTNRIITSPDGVTWTARTAPENNSWNSAVFGDGKFVSVSGSGTNRVMISQGISCTNPVITTQPTAQSASNGTNATFTTVATGDNLTYQWQVSTNAGSTWADLSGEPNSTYTFNNVQSGDNNKQFRVIVSSGSCSVTSTVGVLTVITCTPPTPTISVIESSGTTNNDGTICGSASTSLTANGGSTYLWSTGATTSTINISPSSTTTYTVTATSGDGCTATATQTLTVVTSPTASISVVETSGTTNNDGTICAGSSATLTATGGTSYAWSTGATTASITPSPSSTTTYTVTVTNANGCTATANQNLTVTAIPTPSISVTETSGTTNNDGVICNGSNVTLTASGGTSYVWSTSATTASISPSPSSTTTYSVTVSNANGCTANTSRTVTLLSSSSLVSIDLTESSAGINDDGTICGGASVVLNATTSQSYLWSNGATTQSITVNPNSTITYTVTAVSAGSCGNASDSRIVTVIPIITSIGNISGLTNLGGVTTTTYSVAAVPGATSYNWGLPAGMSIASSTGNSITVNIAPSFNGGQVTVYAMNSCSQSATKVLNVSASVASSGSISITGSIVVCQGQVFTYSVASLPGAQYVWTLPSGIQYVDISASNNSSVQVLVTSLFVSGTISVVRSTSTASLSTNRSLSILATPSAIIGQNSLCIGSTASYSVSSVSGATGYNWEVPVGVNIVSGQGTTSITVEVTGGYNGGTLFVQATNTCGQSLKRSKILLMSPLPSAISGSTQLCPNATRTYSITSSGAYLAYDWVLPSGLSIQNGSNTASISIQASSGFTSGTLKVRTLTDCGWSAYKTFGISAAPSRPGMISGTTLICGATNNIVNTSGGIQQTTSSNTFTYSVPSASTPGVTFNWTMPNGASLISGQGTNQVTVSFNNSVFVQGNLSVVAVSSCGTSAVRNLSVAVSRATLLGPELINGLTTATYSVPSGSGTAYSWTLPSWMTVVGGSLTSNSVTVSFGTDNCGSGSVSLVVTNICGSQYTLTKNVRLSNRTKIANSYVINNPDTYTQIFADNVTGATGYRFKIVGPGLSGGQQIITTTNRCFRFIDLNGAVFGSNYQVQVAVKTNSTSFETNGYGCDATIKYRDKSTYLVNACGSSISLNSNLTIQTVLWSTGYKVKVSGGNLTVPVELVKSTTGFRLNEIPGVINGQTYFIQVAVRYQDGSSFGPFNAGCSYNAVDVTTQLISSNCGMTGASFTTEIKAIAVSGINGYRFRISGSNLTTPVIVDKTTPSFTFNEVSGATINTTYSVEVATLYSDGVTYGPYGASCLVTLGTSQVRIFESTDVEAQEDIKQQEETNESQNLLNADSENGLISNWEVTLYPNPTSEKVNIHSTEKLTKIVLMDMNGKVIYALTPQSLESEINLDYLNSGMYLLQISTDKTSINKPIMKN